MGEAALAEGCFRHETIVGTSGKSYLASNGTLVGGLALDGEGNTVGGLGLDLKVRFGLVSFGVVCAGDCRAKTNPGWRGRSPCSGAMGTEG